MRCLLASIGTDGDIFPHLGLGKELLARGHAVVLAASGHYEPLARAHGLDFHPLASAEENHELFGHPDFWHPFKNAPLLARWGVRFLPRQYAELRQIASPGTLLISSPGVYAATMLHEKEGLPLANLILQPWMIPSCIAPPAMPGFLFLRGAPRPVWRSFWLALDLVAHALGGVKLNRMRTSIGLKPTRRILRAWLSPQLVLGLFPEWYGPPQADWPRQIQLAGFPLFDGGRGEGLDPKVVEFCQGGTPPVAFTFGTGMAHPAALFQSAAQACAQLGIRGLFLTKYADQLPSPLPPTIMCREFAPFQKLFPLCAAAVHHGGIGTVAKAMAAATPQLVWPLCFDQIDNGIRVQKLGVGDWLKPGRAGASMLPAMLARLLAPEVKTRCLEVATRFSPPDGIETAADCLERFMRNAASPEVNGRAQARSNTPAAPAASGAAVSRSKRE